MHEHHCERCGISETRELIARLCRAFFMHVEVASVLGDTTERDLELIARLCRAFFIHCSIFNHYRSA